jgi:nucleoside-diphosphate-sugar epimerase
LRRRQHRWPARRKILNSRGALNVEVTKLLAELAAEIQFVFFSTDLVFDGRKGNYVEADAVNPLHVYGETKAAAEEIVLKNPRTPCYSHVHQRRHFARGQPRLQ